MSLKLRLMASIAASLVLALLLGGAALFWQARAAVRDEVRTGFHGAAKQVRATLTGDVQHTVTMRRIIAALNEGRDSVRACSLPNETARCNESTTKTLYKQRNRIERCFSKLKCFRRFATRYEKSKACFHALVTLACAWLHLRLYVDTAWSESSFFLAHFSLVYLALPLAAAVDFLVGLGLGMLATGGRQTAAAGDIVDTERRAAGELEDASSGERFTLAMAASVESFVLLFSIAYVHN